MNYLSEEIANFSRRIQNHRNSLIKREISCGIFQDYGDSDTKSSQGGTQIAENRD